MNRGGMPRGDRLPDNLRFELDDLSRQPVQDLVARHLAGMHAQSPPESVHALALEGLSAPSIRFWSAWSGQSLAGMGALRRIDAENGEIKSMAAGAAVLGHPLAAVAMMANHLGARGQHIPAGTFIMTGGVTEAYLVNPGDNVSVRFQDLGTVSMRFV